MTREGDDEYEPLSTWCSSVSDESSRNDLQTPPLLDLSPFHATSSNDATSAYEQLLGGRRSESPPSIVEHHFEPQSPPPPPRRPPGTFEYGHTYGSSTYRHDQATFLGTPRLSTRYQPDHASFRQLNRPLSDNRRRQFSPFMNFSKYQEKNARDDSPEPAAINRST